uniref:Uncharacterized protein n=1 Tax=Lepeophtheirus salmonis TaxID=72036 RepID=A0A0K2TFY9_LEPSM
MAGMQQDLSSPTRHASYASQVGYFLQQTQPVRHHISWAIMTQLNITFIFLVIVVFLCRHYSLVVLELHLRAIPEVPLYPVDTCLLHRLANLPLVLIPLDNNLCPLRAH